MVNEELSGVELLALYGEDSGELIGYDFKKFAKKAVKVTPQYWAYRAGKYGLQKAKKIHGDERFGAEIELEGSMPEFSLNEYRINEFHPDQFANPAEFKDQGEFILLGADKKKKKFLPGAGKAFKSVGKYTSGFTTAAAQAVGVPKPLLTALAKFDPTKKGGGSSTQAIQAFTAETAKQQMEQQQSKPQSEMFKNIDFKKIAIIGGSGIAALILLKILLGSGK